MKALGGPFADVRFCPTGGVNAANAAQYLALASVMCVGGTWMIDGASLSSGDWAGIQQRTAQALDALA